MHNSTENIPNSEFFAYIIDMWSEVVDAQLFPGEIEAISTFLQVGTSIPGILLGFFSFFFFNNTINRLLNLIPLVQWYLIKVVLVY